MVLETEPIVTVIVAVPCLDANNFDAIIFTTTDGRFIHRGYTTVGRADREVLGWKDFLSRCSQT
jgi:hypothetical protein